LWRDPVDLLLTQLVSESDNTVVLDRQLESTTFLLEARTCSLRLCSHFWARESHVCWAYMSQGTPAK